MRPASLQQLSSCIIHVPNIYPPGLSRIPDFGTACFQTTGLENYWMSRLEMPSLWPERRRAQTPRKKAARRAENTSVEYQTVLVRNRNPKVPSFQQSKVSTPNQTPPRCTNQK